jgi:hypothetical protein
MRLESVARSESGVVRNGANTPLEPGPRDLLLQGIIFDQPLPKGWSEAAQRAIAETGWAG